MRIRTPTRFLTPRVIHRPAASLGITGTLPALDPTFIDDNSPFPSIPTIRNEGIRTRVFTHRGFCQRPSSVFEDPPDDPSPDNERYELLGDTVLGLAITNLLMKMYPNLRVGPYTAIRSLTICNSTLAAISRRYTLPEELRIHPAQPESIRASANIQADLFESYVGGLYLDQGLVVVEKWLEELFKPYANEAYIRVRTRFRLPPLPVSPQLTPSSVSSTSAGSLSSTDATSLTYPHPSTHSIPVHLGIFCEKMQKRKREVKFYDDFVSDGTPTTVMWTSRMEVDGVVFGHGKGGTKKEARNEAAKKGLIHMSIVE